MTAAARCSAIVRCLAAALVLSACAPWTPPIVAETPHVVLHASRPPEPALVDWLEHVAATYAGYLGIPDQRVVIVRYDTADQVEAACHVSFPSADVVGCAVGDTVYTNADYFPHEIVHAVAHGLGDPPLWLEEGLAEAIGGVPGDAAIEPDPAISSWLTSDGFESGGFDAQRARYWPAASFVRFLIQTRGLEPLLRFYASVSHDASVDEQARAFSEAFDGETLEGAIAEWTAGGPLPWSWIALLLPECAMPALELGGVAAIELQRGISPDPGPDDSPHAVRTVSLDAPTRLLVTLDGETDGRGVRLVGCDRGAWARATVIRPDTRSTVAWDLLPGRYALIFAAPPEAPNAAMSDVVAMAGPAACGARLDIGTADDVVLYPARSEPWLECPDDCTAWYSLGSAAAARRLTIHPVEYIDSPDRVSYSSALECSMSCDITACTSLDPLRAVVDVAPASTVNLAFQTAGTAGDFAIVVRSAPL